jgi:hypothetical protein
MGPARDRLSLPVRREVALSMIELRKLARTAREATWSDWLITAPLFLYMFVFSGAVFIVPVAAVVVLIMWIKGKRPEPVAAKSGEPEFGKIMVSEPGPPFRFSTAITCARSARLPRHARR